MKLGAENRKELIAAVVLGAIALFVLVRAILPSGGDATAAPVAAAVQPQRQTRAAETQSIDPRLRLDLLAASEKVTYEGGGRDIFRSGPEPPSIPKVLTPPVMAQPEGPPPPPPINIKFFGFANKPGERPKIFLLQGEDTFVASEGDIVNRRYKVLHIMRDSVDIEDLLYNHTQRIPLTQS